jgi:hypothetical protein
LPDFASYGHARHIFGERKPLPVAQRTAFPFQPRAIGRRLLGGEAGVEAQRKIQEPVQMRLTESRWKTSHDAARSQPDSQFIP